MHFVLQQSVRGIVGSPGALASGLLVRAAPTFLLPYIVAFLGGSVGHRSRSGKSQPAAPEGYEIERVAVIVRLHRRADGPSAAGMPPSAE